MQGLRSQYVHVLRTIIMARACTTSIVHARTTIIMHACTTIRVRACTMILARAFSVIIVHACTMLIIHTCSMIIVHERTTIKVHNTDRGIERSMERRATSGGNMCCIRTKNWSQLELQKSIWHADYCVGEDFWKLVGLTQPRCVFTRTKILQRKKDQLFWNPEYF